MSPHAVNSFVTDLVQMAQAMERVPALEARIAELESILDTKDNAFNSTLSDLTQARDYAASLEQRLHNAEVARDDAELRFLELDEKASRALGALGNIMANVNDAVKDLSPPKPQPMPEASQPQAGSIPAQSEPSGQSEANPSKASTEQSNGHTQSSFETPQMEHSTSLEHGDDHLKLPEEAKPSEGNPSNENVASQPVDASATTELSSANGPYSNKRYYNIPTWMPLEDWLAGGGTEADYHWRPAGVY